jgi:hypothetical protein
MYTKSLKYFLSCINSCGPASTYKLLHHSVRLTFFASALLFSCTAQGQVATLRHKQNHEICIIGGIGCTRQQPYYVRGGLNSKSDWVGLTRPYYLRVESRTKNKEGYLGVGCQFTFQAVQKFYEYDANNSPKYESLSQAYQLWALTFPVRYAVCYQKVNLYAQAAVGIKNKSVYYESKKTIDQNGKYTSSETWPKTTTHPPSPVI